MPLKTQTNDWVKAARQAMRAEMHSGAAWYISESRGSVKLEVLHEGKKQSRILEYEWDKKGLFNADRSNEVSLMNILKPLINSESIWKSHALFLVAEFFYSKNEKQKAREFYEKIISLENANSNIKINSQKRLNRDISD